MNPYMRFLPGFVVSLGVVYLAVAMAPPAEPSGEMRLEEFAKIPVVDRGRVKPLDTLARTSLMLISGRQDYKDEAGHTQPAIKWLLNAMTSGAVFKHANEDNATFTIPAERDKVFRIDNDQLLTLLELKPRSGLRYSIEEFRPKSEQFFQEANVAQKKNPKERDVYGTKLVALGEHLQLYIQLSELHTLRLIPPSVPGGEWKTLREAAHERSATGKDDPLFQAFMSMLLAYAKNDKKDFNSELAAYQKQLDNQKVAEARTTNLEVFFNHFEPFYQCAVLDLGVILLSCLAFLLTGFAKLDWAEGLRRSAFWLAVMVLVAHTWALGTRMYIQGRPPVTNLYSSAVFIGWGSAILGIILEAIFRIGVGNLLAGALGASTLVFAQHLAQGGDTLEMMQAVLDTNFWLATHVTCVSFGYVATLVAGFLGFAFIFLGVLTPALDRKTFKLLGQMIYGTVCFATLLSFTGTVLGGLWADYSWGRFWGWDPKENGALLIVIMNALILHARWGGIVKQRGMAVLAVCGAMVTGWSWVGTNQLGVGLHAYGFNNTLAVGLVWFWVACLGILGMGLLPVKKWRSFGTDAK